MAIRAALNVDIEVLIRKRSKKIQCRSCGNSQRVAIPSFIHEMLHKFDRVIGTMYTGGHYPLAEEVPKSEKSLRTDEVKTILNVVCPFEIGNDLV